MESALVPLRSLPNDSNPYMLQLCKEYQYYCGIQLRSNTDSKKDRHAGQPLSSNTDITQQQQQSFYGPLSGTTG